MPAKNMTGGRLAPMSEGSQNGIARLQRKSLQPKKVNAVNCSGKEMKLGPMGHHVISRL